MERNFRYNQLTKWEHKRREEMIYKIILTFLVIVLFGCGTVPVRDQVLMDFETLDLTRLKGIDQETALLIAQKSLIDTFLDKNYKLSDPKIIVGPAEVRNYNRYWYVSFKETTQSTIPFIYVVVVRKEDGKVCFSDDYQVERKWILESAVRSLEASP